MKDKFYELQFEIETNCQLNCIHCSSVDSRGKARAYTDENILNFLKLFPGAVRIYFTGGEPLLYEGFLPLCRKISTEKANVGIGVYSTGNCTDFRPITKAFAADMRDSAICDCYFSIYSNAQAEHDQWTRRTGSFQNTIDSIKALSDVGISAKAHLVLTRENYHKISDVIHFCQEIGLNEIRILRLAPSGNAKIYWDKIGIPVEIQNKQIINIIQNQNNYSVRLTFAGYPMLHPCRPFPDAQKCQAGTNLLYIDSWGDIYPCACAKQDAFNNKICNISELDSITQYLHQLAEKNCNSICINDSGAIETVVNSD